MKIAKDCVVTLDYVLKNDQGEVQESSKGDNPWVYLHGHGELMPGLEAKLEGKATGQKIKVKLPPEQAYGHFEDDLVTNVPVEAFAGVENLQVGMRLAAEAEDGVHAVVIRAIGGDTVEVDANHPLAGQTVAIEVKVLSVRAAHPEEISHGHAHGPGGHQH